MTRLSAVAPIVESIDARGLECPRPVLLARSALRAGLPGELFEVLATDPHAELDFEAFCARTTHELVLSERLSDGTRRFVIRRGPERDRKPATGG